MRGHTDEEKKDFDRKNSAVPSGASGNSGAGVISLYIRWTGRNGQKSGNVLDSLVWNRQIRKRLIYKSVLWNTTQSADWCDFGNDLWRDRNSDRSYIGGKTDLVLSELMNILSAVPSLLYIILIQLAFHPGMGSVILGFCVAGWVDLARLFRAETMRQKEMEYCMAAKMMGVSSFRIIGKYILPNARQLLKVQMLLLVPKAIFTEAFLSFLGIGIAAPQASLGTLIQDAKAQIMLYPLQMVYPVVILILLFLSLQGIITKEQRL